MCVVWFVVLVCCLAWQTFVFRGFVGDNQKVLTGGPWRPSVYEQSNLLKCFAEEKQDPDAWEETDFDENMVLVISEEANFATPKGFVFTDKEAYNTAMKVFVAYFNLLERNINVLVDIPEDCFTMPKNKEDLDVIKPDWRLDDMVKPCDHVVSL